MSQVHCGIWQYILIHDNVTTPQNFPGDRIGMGLRILDTHPFRINQFPAIFVHVNCLHKHKQLHPITKSQNFLFHEELDLGCKLFLCNERHFRTLHLIYSECQMRIYDHIIESDKYGNRDCHVRYICIPVNTDH